MGCAGQRRLGHATGMAQFSQPGGEPSATISA